MTTTRPAGSPQSPLVLEQGVPVPPPARGGRPIYDHQFWPWREMQVGDSFFVPNGQFSKKSFNAQVSTQARRLGITLVTRVWEQENEAGEKVKGVRVWRTA